MSGKSKYIIDSFGRQCTLCNEYKLWDEFDKQSSQKSGYRPRCKQCYSISYGHKPNRYKIDKTGRECTFCKKYKTWDKFHKRKISSTGHTPICKECASIYNKLLKYGVSIEEYTNVIDKSNGECMICGHFATKENSRGQGLFVDHCHITGNMRGLLCNKCNLAISAAKDSIEIIQNAILYLSYSPFSIAYKPKIGRVAFDYEKAYRLQKKFGITIDQFNFMAKSQSFSCAICKLKDKDVEKSMAVDHCHKKNIIRGLLCFDCNKLLGLVNDSTEILKNAVVYLERN